MVYPVEVLSVVGGTMLGTMLGTMARVVPLPGTKNGTTLLLSHSLSVYYPDHLKSLAIFQAAAAMAAASRIQNPAICRR